MADWLGENLWALWTGAAILLGVAELASLDLVLLMLAVGALGGAVTAALTPVFAIQALVAAVVAIGLLALVRPNLVKRLHSGPDLRHGPAALVGTSGYAVEEITSRGGLAKLSGEVWTARPYDESDTIPAGTKVEVFEIRGATAYVHAVPELGS